MKGLSKWYGTGNVGADPDVRTTAGGIRVARFSLAVNRKKGDEEVTDWFRISAWRGLADIVERYVRKGSRVMVDGALSIDTYEKDGQTRTSVEIDARDLVLLDPPNTSPEQHPSSEGSASPFATRDEFLF